MRSRVTQMIEDFHALNEVEQKVFLDQVDPQPEQEAPAKKTRKKRVARSAHAESLSNAIAKTPKAETTPAPESEESGPKCSVCNYPEEYQDHFPPSPFYHKFEPVKSAGKRSSRKKETGSLGQSIEAATENVMAVGASGD